MDIHKFFCPDSIAVIGASRTSTKAGGVVVNNLIKFGYAGKIYPVNPSADEIDGLKCYPSVGQIKEKVDLAVIVIPAQFVAGELEKCGKKGIKNVIILSGGFGEIGEKAREEELKAIAKKYKIRVLGPNCVGIIDTYSKIDTMFLPRYRMATPLKGKISFITQSGAVGATSVDWAARQKLGFSKMISYGNRLDVDEVELLEFLENDPNTSTIMMYIESLARGREFIKTACRLTKSKPIVVVKSGRTEHGAKAVQSHTGSLAGSDRIYDAAFKESGVIRANSIEQMFDYSKALSRQPPAKGNRIQIVTCGGGFGVMATDKVESLGMQLAQIDEQRKARLKQHFPEHVVVSNPLDLTGDATPEMFETALRECLADDNVDGVIAIFLFQLPKLDYSLISVIEDVLADFQKPMVGVSAGSEFSAMHTSLLEEIGLPMYATPERAADAMLALVVQGKNRSTSSARAAEGSVCHPQSDSARRTLRRPVPCRHSSA